MSEPSPVLAIILKAILLLLWAPFVQGAIKRTKAWLQRRHGPPVLQPFADLRKYFRKEMVVSPTATWLFHTAPFVNAAATAAAAFLVPMALVASAWPGAEAAVGAGASASAGLGGDMLLVVGFLALARFAMAGAALESGSSFGGMGSSREMAVSAFVEPALLLTLGVFTVRTGTTGLGGMAAGLASTLTSRAFPGQLLAAGALLLIVVAETGRVPVDNPDTHLELTMIHEGLVLEYSGPYLALITWSHDVKQLLMLSLLADLALPVGMVGPLALTIPVFLLKTLGFGMLLAFIETAMAKVRILKIPDLLLTASALSILAALADLHLGGR